MPSGRVHTILASVLLGLLCLALFLPAGCAPKLPPEPAWEQQARALLAQADDFFARRQYEESAKTLKTFFATYPKSKLADRALFLAGEVRLIRRDYPQALSYYKDLIEKFPSSPLILDAKYKLGVCYFELGEFDLAIADLEDRRGITDPVRLRRIAEMLSSAYTAKQNFLAAVREYAYLAGTAPNDQQKAGYRDRIRELIEKDLNEQDLATLAAVAAYPADLAQLRLAQVQLDERKYRDAIKTAKDFLDRYPNHPERTRAEMLLNDATAKLSSPRYVLAALLPQSGQLAFFGDRVLKGVELAVHEYNTQHPDDRVELLVKDTEGLPDKAVAALDEVAAKNVVAVIGPLLTREAEAVAPELDKLKVPVITPAASGEGIGKLSPWLFRNALTNAGQAAAAAQYGLGLNLKKFVIIYPDDAYGKDLMRLFTADLERKAEILASVAYPPDVRDFGPTIRKVIEIDLRSRKVPIPDDDAERKKLFQDYTPGFDGLYLPGYADKVGLLIPNLAFYNMTGIAMIGSNNWHAQDLIDRAQRYAEGAVFVDGFFPESTDPAIKSMVDAYRSAFNETPDILAAQAYDAAAMVLYLISNHKDTPQAVRDGLLGLKDYPGVSGATTFPGNGEATKKLFLIKVQDGKFTLVSNGSGTTK